MKFNVNPSLRAGFPASRCSDASLLPVMVVLVLMPGSMGGRDTPRWRNRRRYRPPTRAPPCVEIISSFSGCVDRACWSAITGHLLRGRSAPATVATACGSNSMRQQQDGWKFAHGRRPRPEPRCGHIGQPAARACDWESEERLHGYGLSYLSTT